MSNDKNNLVYREQLDDNVIEMLSEDIGSNYSLRTENTKTIVAALNEILGKDIICNAVGSPLLTTDTFAELGEKIHVMVNDFKAKLLGLGVSVSSVDKLASMIEKLSDVVLDDPDVDAALSESLKGILEENGVELEGNESLTELIVKVDEVITEKDNKINDIRQELIDALTNKGVDVDENISLEELVSDATKYRLMAGTSGNFVTTLLSGSVNLYYRDIYTHAAVIDKTLTFDDSKFILNSATLSFSRTIPSGHATFDANIYIYHMRDGEILKTLLTSEGTNGNEFKNYSTTVTDLRIGDVIRMDVAACSINSSSGDYNTLAFNLKAKLDV